MKKFFQNILGGLRRFHQDEQGIETINVVMILAIAAFVVIVLFAAGRDIVDWMKGKIDEMKQEKIDY